MTEEEVAKRLQADAIAHGLISTPLEYASGLQVFRISMAFAKDSMVVAQACLDRGVRIAELERQLAEARQNARSALALVNKWMAENSIGCKHLVILELDRIIEPKETAHPKEAA